MIYVKDGEGFVKITKLIQVTVFENKIGIASDESYPVSYMMPSNWTSDNTKTLIVELERLISSDYTKMMFVDPQKLIELIVGQNKEIVTDNQDESIKVTVDSEQV